MINLYMRQLLPIDKEKLSLANLSKDILYKYSSEFSGGNKKRIDLARTLITNMIGLDPIIFNNT